MKRISQRLLIVASVCLSVSAVIFLGLLLFGYEKVWLLPTASAVFRCRCFFRQLFRRFFR